MRTWRIGKRTPASSSRSIRVADVGAPAAVGGPAKNEVCLEAETKNDGCQRSYVYVALQSGIERFGSAASEGPDASHVALAA